MDELETKIGSNGPSGVASAPDVSPANPPPSPATQTAAGNNPRTTATPPASQASATVSTARMEPAPPSPAPVGGTVSVLTPGKAEDRGFVPKYEDNGCAIEEDVEYADGDQGHVLAVLSLLLAE